jgi:hypothetical protein
MITECSLITTIEVILRLDRLRVDLVGLLTELLLFLAFLPVAHSPLLAYLR